MRRHPMHTYVHTIVCMYLKKIPCLCLGRCLGWWRYACIRVLTANHAKFGGTLASSEAGTGIVGVKLLKW